MSKKSDEPRPWRKFRYVSERKGYPGVWRTSWYADYEYDIKGIAYNAIIANGVAYTNTRDTELPTHEEIWFRRSVPQSKGALSRIQHCGPRRRRRGWRFRVGDTLHHKDYGEGVVTDCGENGRYLFYPQSLEHQHLQSRIKNVGNLDTYPWCYERELTLVSRPCLHLCGEAGVLSSRYSWQQSQLPAGVDLCCITDRHHGDLSALESSVGAARRSMAEMKKSHYIVSQQTTS